jgi:glycosyltransferase involved in cell wall biosynthesis
MTSTYLLDARFAQPGRLDGVGRIVWNTMVHVLDLLAPDERLVVFSTPDTTEMFRQAAPGAAHVPLDVPIASASQHARWSRAVAAVHPDVVHYPQFDLPAVPEGVRACAVVHDFTPLDEPAYFGRARSWRRLAATALTASGMARADALIVHSKFVRAQVLARHPPSRPRLHLAPPGPSHLPAVSAVERRQARFVYVGNHRPHKRVDILLAAFALVRAVRPDAELFLLGRSDPRFPATAARARDAPGVTLVESPSDMDVARALASARALVFASTGEGFGFPVVEAFSVGTPAIVADAGALPEVASAGGWVVAPPDDPRAWCAAMLGLAHEDARFEALVDGARAVHKRLQWRDTAAATLAVWRGVQSGAPRAGAPT